MPDCLEPGYGLATAEIIYRLPDHQRILQTYIWQEYDVFPKFPTLKKFLAFWEREIQGPLFGVTVTHSNLITPAEFRAANGIFRIH